MKEFFKKSMYVGLGLANMTKDKIEALAKEMANYSKMSEEEGKKFAEFLQTESKKASAGLKETIDKTVQGAMKTLRFKCRLTRLEERVAVLEKAAGIVPPPEEPEETEEPEEGLECGCEQGEEPRAE